jgi:hypothetical protein
MTRKAEQKILGLPVAERPRVKERKAEVDKLAKQLAAVDAKIQRWYSQRSLEASKERIAADAAKVRRNEVVNYYSPDQGSLEALYRERTTLRTALDAATQDYERVQVDEGRALVRDNLATLHALHLANARALVAFNATNQAAEDYHKNLVEAGGYYVVQPPRLPDEIANVGDRNSRLGYYVHECLQAGYFKTRDLGGS